jgi:hypothetical protein
MRIITSLLVCYTALVAQSTPHIATVVRTETPRPNTPESAVHKHARMELAQLIQSVQKTIDWKPGGEWTIEEALSDQIAVARSELYLAHEIDKRDASELSLNNLSQKTDLFKKLLAAQDELSVLTTKLRYVDTCASVYRKTIDKKAGDMTLRDSEQVNECRSLDLYPPAK